MLKSYSYYFLCWILAFWACGSSTSVPNTQGMLNDIAALHEAAELPIAATTFQTLKQQEKWILEHTKEVPDYLRGDHAFLLGAFYKGVGQADSAAIYFHQAINFIEDSITSDHQIDYFQLAWDNYFDQGKIGDCIVISEQFKSLLGDTEDHNALTLYYFFKENECKSSRDYACALRNNEQRVKILELLQDTVHLGSALVSQAQSKYRLKEKAEAFAILDQLIERKASLSNDVKRQLYGNYGVYLYYKGDFEKALKYYLEGLKFTKKTSDADSKKNRLVTAYSNIAEVHLELKNYDLAQVYIDSALQQGFNNIASKLQESILIYQFRLAAETNKDVKSVIKYINSISEFQRKEYETKYKQDLDAVKQSNEKAMQLLEDKRQAEVNNLSLRSRLLFLIVMLTILSLIVVVGVLFYRQRKYNFEKQNLQMQQRLLRSQMNPHFTFNILYMIQNMIKENQEAAVKYLLKFSRLLRLILENSTQNYVPLSKEIESITRYLELQLLRFPDKFTYQINLQNLSEEDFIFIPPMLLQPFIENAIEHGFAGIDYLGEITLNLSIENDHLRCVIEDNGVGIQSSVGKHHTKSTQLISNFLIKATQTKVELKNKNQMDAQARGTIVSFIIPFKNSEDD